ncbi:MAG: phosphate starvation-inducible protein PhoH [Spartobacteria bacterium AMD-G5]|nr:MAG: phosphate starvation-inducible protein PhoH [Spartobacteria bacterium AMD-G5]
METLTLEFENARIAQSLYAGDPKLLKDLEARLGVRATARDGWIRFEGEKPAIDRARSVFDQLQTAAKQGVSIQRQEFLQALDSVSPNASAEPLSSLIETKIHCSPRKPPVVPRTAGQKSYLQSIQSHDITFGVGPAGTGKTYLAVACAVAALKQEKIKRIVLTRPAVEAGEALGFLPGALEEKILPYLRPLYDALHDLLEAEELQKLMDRNIIEIAPLAYMRGRTLGNSFVILDEAQNTTAEQMLMFLTRLGIGSKCVVTGDVTQIDLPRNKLSGLVEAVSALRDVQGIGMHFFTEKDVVRHPLVQSIVLAYKDHRGSRESRI